MINIFDPYYNQSGGGYNPNGPQTGGGMPSGPSGPIQYVENPYINQGQFGNPVGPFIPSGNSQGSITVGRISGDVGTQNPYNGAIPIEVTRDTSTPYYPPGPIYYPPGPVYGGPNIDNSGNGPIKVERVPLPVEPSKIAGTNTNVTATNASNNNASYKTDLSPYKDVRQSTGGTGNQKVTSEKQIDLQDPMYIPSNTRVYKRFDYNNDVIENTKRVQTKGIWGRDDCTGLAGGTGSLGTFFTSSAQTTAAKAYYYDVLISADKCTSEFSVTYGHSDGSGSYSGGGQTNDSPSRAIYSQYKLLTDTTSSLFTFSDNTTSKQIYVVNINKTRLGDNLDPGNWELTLGKLNGDGVANAFYTGSNVALTSSGEVFKLVDNSEDSDQRYSDRNLTARRYSVVSGSISNGVYSTGSYGWVYPNLGVIILNGDKMDAEMGFNSMTGSNVNGDNSMKLFKSISGSASPIGSRTATHTFDARNSKLVTQAHYFVRIPNKEFNYSNNPTYVTGSLGDLRHESFISDPKTYITTIGLYNDYNELIAVAKLSQPVKKSFTEEKLYEIKVEY